ncbi:thermonuclease family protein [Bacillus sp. FJAT-26377]|nr:thermonuclease family protein [Bacillus sp. FJAT-26377]
MDGHVERIRLILVDTPETVHPTKDEQPYGKEASTFTKKTLLKKEVNVELDKQKRDKYDRLLAYIFLDDGTNYNKLLLEKGLAKVAVFPPNVKYIDEFKSAEATAKRDKIGIWSDLQ